MVEKMSPVKNPLTIIAIFAAIAEISGTVILPFIAPTNQTVYVWFLMIFPILLIVLFFLTLNFNHKVLYAPSDYKNEDNFLHSLPRATFAEKVRKIEAELADETAAVSFPTNDLLPNLRDPLAAGSTSSGAAAVSAIGVDAIAPVGDVFATGSANGVIVTVGAPLTADVLCVGTSCVAAESTAGAHEARVEAGAVTEKFARVSIVDVARMQPPQPQPASQKSISRNAQATYMLAEELIFEKLGNEFSSNIHREIKLGQGGRYIFDGIVNEKGVTTIIEVKFIRDNVNGIKRLQATIRSIDESIKLLPRDQAPNLRLLLVIIATDSNVSQERLAAHIEKYRSNSLFPIDFRYFNLDDLKRDAGLVATSESEGISISRP